MLYGNIYDSSFPIIFSILQGYFCDTLGFRDIVWSSPIANCLFVPFFFTLCSEQRIGWPRYMLIQCSMLHVRTQYCIRRQVATCIVLPQSLLVLFWMCWAHRTPLKKTGTAPTMMHFLSLPFLVLPLSPPLGKLDSNCQETLSLSLFF